ncbi:hypothetical protein S245_062243, partial [Arachis hypogaea]
GLVNDQFLSLKNTEELDCVVQIIDKYFEYVDMILPELSCQFDNSKVDFSKLASLVREIEEKSTSIGTEHMRLACSVLIKACDENNKKSFTQSLLWLKREFSNTKNKLTSIIQ